MKVFLSWSGERSCLLASALKVWLKRVIQALDPWLSVDIEKGARWSGEIQAALEESRIGIICLTPENVDAPWINFEAGAIAKLPGAHVCTLLLDLKREEVRPPLGQFQHTLFTKDEMFKLMGTINEKLLASGAQRLEQDNLLATFEMFWPKLEREVAQIPIPVADQVPIRQMPEMMAEALEILRGLQRAQVEGELLASPKFVGADLSPDMKKLQVYKYAEDYLNKHGYRDTTEIKGDKIVVKLNAGENLTETLTKLKPLEEMLKIVGSGLFFEPSAADADAGSLQP